MFCFLVFFFNSLTVKEQEGKTDLKDQMGVHLLTLPPTVSCARYGFFSLWKTGRLAGVNVQNVIFNFFFGKLSKQSDAVV